MQANDANYQRLRNRLSAVGQEHVLRFWSELTEAQRRRLAEHIDALDLELVAKLYAERNAAEDYKSLAARAEPPPAFRLNEDNASIGREKAREVGIRAISAGKVGAILVAGGQGSRLGFEHPKGMFQIGPVSGHSLFQILFEKLAATSERYGAAIPIYVMTSDATHDETVAYLQEHRFFGLAKENVRFFQQGNLPAVDAENGKLLLASPSSLALSPDGHGGMLSALVRSGSLADIQSRGLEQLFYFQVDNPLVDMCDPVFIGYHLASGSEMSTQVIAKTAGDDRVGNVVSIDGKVQIIEYSDLPAEAGEQRNPDGSLRLWAGSVAVHVFDVAFLAKIASTQGGMPFHVARKAVAYVDEASELITPAGDEKNAIKFEQFIFDLLPAAKRSIVMEVSGPESFGPVKNASGAKKDSPETSQAQMIALHRKWLQAAGVEIADDVAVEIRPTFALDAEQVAARVELPCVVREPRLFE